MDEKAAEGGTEERRQQDGSETQEITGALMAMPPHVHAATPVLAPLPPELWPNVDHLVTEDGAPVDGIYSERQMRLLTEPLYASWTGPPDQQKFVALANVGVFFGLNRPPIVPDVLVSLDVALPEDVFLKQNRSYFVWVYGKPPDVVFEIVSNREGEEAGEKLRIYARIGVAYYIIWDPDNELGDGTLKIFVLRGNKYEATVERWLPAVGLGLTIWQGEYEGYLGEWLRWCDGHGNVILTGAERAEQEQQRADQEQQRADQEQQRADQEQQRADQAHQRAERLAAQMRALGLEPNGTNKE